jgi:hypothetical protein
MRKGFRVLYKILHTHESGEQGDVERKGRVSGRGRD